LGLEQGSYEAYCLDEAVIYFGLTVEAKLDEADHKPSKEERKARAARENMLKKLFSEETESTSGFSDPALMFT
jgi:hypothetical protein